MTELINHPALALGVSRYPNYAQALAYLRNFLRRGRRAFIRTNRYAYYQHTPSLQVLVSRLAPDIFEVRAYPVDGHSFPTLGEALAAEEFRGWLFTLDYLTNRIYYITGSQKEGVELYKLIRLAIKHKGGLTRASRFYQALLNRG
ncbi:hypothetical protein ES708_31428 [subsurface metagenome]